MLCSNGTLKLMRVFCACNVQENLLRTAISHQDMQWVQSMQTAE